jgi:hypothetical protein
MKLELSRQIFEKEIKYRFNKIRLVRAELLHADGRIDGQTDGHDKANSRFLQFCKCA